MSDKFYCMYCGTSENSIFQLTSGSCNNNPENNNHVLYEGSEKDRYTCKYCGASDSSMYGLTHSSCSKSPTNRHIPSRN